MTALGGTPTDWPASPATPAAPPRVVRAETAAEFAAVRELRRRVFGDEQGIVDAAVNDRDDARSLHALALLPVVAADGPPGAASGDAGWRPVGTGRLTLNFGERGEALIAWVATVPEARRHGVGTAVMRFLLAAADEAGAPLVVLAAQTHAERFYRRLGFLPAGQPYEVRGVPHRWMARYQPTRQ